MRYGFYYDTLIGRLGIVSSLEKIVEIGMDVSFDVLEETKIIKECYQELEEYFTNKRRSFTVPIHIEGTLFQKKVYEVLLSIPYGETLSYQDVAIKIKKPKASRAVGMACNKNKIIIIIPCHRVIGKNKKLVGFALGLDTKEKLLEIEKKIVK